jgi:hypothetical protein
MQLDVILPVAPDTATYQLFDQAAPTVALDTIATANVQVFTQDFITFVPISGHTYIANATINKVGFARTVYLSNTSVAP